jgi:hypothetical protein
LGQFGGQCSLVSASPPFGEILEGGFTDKESPRKTDVLGILKAETPFEMSVKFQAGIISCF